MTFYAPGVVPRYRTRTAVLCALAVFATPLCGEVAAQETPGQIEKRFQPPVRPKATGKPPELKIPERLPPREARKIKFILVGVVVEGSTVYQDSDFLPLYEEWRRTQPDGGLGSVRPRSLNPTAPRRTLRAHANIQ